MSESKPPTITSVEALREIYDHCEGGRARAINKSKRYAKNNRFKKAAAYWEGFAQACANNRTVVGAYQRLVGDRDKASQPDTMGRDVISGHNNAFEG